MDYLRLAVTDRCNLRCRYCMPAQGIDFVHREELLSYDELLRLTSIFRDHGVTKIRITGGEPFVRKDMALLIRELYQQFDQVHLTTNATRIHDHMELLSHPHMKGMNISLDSLDKENFSRITRRDELGQVMHNLLQALELGIPLKLNVVVMRGMNDEEIPAFLDFGAEHGIPIRFIEAMPFNASDGNKGLFISYKEILESIDSARPGFKEVTSARPSAAIHFENSQGQQVDIIPAYSRLQCGTCNRIRLTPKGKMLTCLYAKTGLDLKERMRNGMASDEELGKAIQDAILNKKKNGFEEEDARHESVFQSMTSIGG
ncbi:MAG: GTP 3',8-cyclase MoaA [Flavobacteriales bacterium]|nr:GTP 3',8-cyclase MoaA [Flavobacteriales bacterium]